MLQEATGLAVLHTYVPTARERERCIFSLPPEEEKKLLLGMEEIFLSLFLVLLCPERASYWTDRLVLEKKSYFHFLARAVCLSVCYILRGSQSSACIKKVKGLHFEFHREIFGRVDPRTPMRGFLRGWFFPRVKMSFLPFRSSS